MKAKLIKEDGHYFLEVEPNTWTPPNRFHSIIANTLEKTKGDILQLSFKNCQAIERGYDLDELADENVSEIHEENTDFMFKDIYREYFKEGFQKALELMGDKKYTNLDLIEAIAETWNKKKTTIQIIQSLQQTDWDVEIEMRSKDIDELRESNEGFLNNSNLYVPKLDADGCLILKRV
jgi:hypothetical protein